MANYIVHNVTTNTRQTCAAEDEAWMLIDQRGVDHAWLGPDDRWELLCLRNSLSYVLAWGTGPCHKDDWIRDHRLAPR